MVPRRTPEGNAATDLILQMFRTHGMLLGAGDRLAALDDLTAARWQVLGALTLAGRPLTVPQISRRMGLARQSVQASVNRLLDDALVETIENPDHRRSVLVRLTRLGANKYARVERRQRTWVNALAARIPLPDLMTAKEVLEEFDRRLETGTRHRSRGDGDEAS
jgi:DNA-binding MarR family transcriptional regulator